jgi:lipoate-protein ligase A
MDTTSEPQKPKWRVLPFSENDGETNMAIDEAILISRSENKVPNTIRFYRWKPSTASIGRNQSLSREIDVDAAKANNIGLVRRISGGGAVYHDKINEITYAVICSEADIRNIFKKITKDFSCPEEIKTKDQDAEKTVSKSTDSTLFGVDSSYHVITRGLVNGLKSMGVEVDQGVIHCPALFINNRKISGNAQARKGDIILQHGTILLHVDPEFMYTILKAPEGVTKGKMVSSVKAKVTGVFDNLPPVSDFEFQIKMIRGFEEALGIKCELSELTPEERNLIKEIKKKRYSDDSWLNRIP